MPAGIGYPAPGMGGQMGAPMGGPMPAGDPMAQMADEDMISQLLAMLAAEEGQMPGGGMGGEGQIDPARLAALLAKLQGGMGQEMPMPMGQGVPPQVA